jgi:hypothetical protein
MNGLPIEAPIDYLPIWGVFVATVLITLLAVEGGFRLAQYRRKGTEAEKEAAVGAMVGATLGLLGFVLAFTFGWAATRFDARRQALLEESNAIGTTYLRADMLPEPYRTNIRGELRDYVDVRLRGADPARTEQALVRSEQLHGLLWEQTVALGREDARSVVAGLFIQSLNEVIDVHAKRALLLRTRIPATIWFALYFVAIIAMASMGYHDGMHDNRRSLALLALVLTFSAVMLLIADLDRPHEGLLRVSQQSMIDLQKSMQPANP